MIKKKKIEEKKEIFDSSNPKWNKLWEDVSVSRYPEDSKEKEKESIERAMKIVKKCKSKERLAQEEKEREERKRHKKKQLENEKKLEKIRKEAEDKEKKLRIEEQNKKARAQNNNHNFNENYSIEKPLTDFSNDESANPRSLLQGTISSELINHNDISKERSAIPDPFFQKQNRDFFKENEMYKSKLRKREKNDGISKSKKLVIISESIPLKKHKEKSNIAVKEASGNNSIRDKNEEEKGESLSITLEESNDQGKFLYF